eukprot:1194713-Prorocentrum_minimum.AAC.4
MCLIDRILSVYRRASRGDHAHDQRGGPPSERHSAAAGRAVPRGPLRVHAGGHPQHGHQRLARHRPARHKAGQPRAPPATPGTGNREALLEVEGCLRGSEGGQPRAPPAAPGTGGLVMGWTPPWADGGEPGRALAAHPLPRGRDLCHG